MVERAHNLFNGRLTVRAVGVDNVDIGQVQALQGQIQAFDNVFAREAFVVERVGGVGGICLAVIDLTCLAYTTRLL